MARFMGASQGAFGITIVGGGPYADTDDPTVNVLWLGQGGLGLPEREYYLDDQFKPQRDAYRAYIVRTLRLTGAKNPEAAADAIMAFETEIAKVSWKIADRRDIGKINNPMSSAELAAYAPGLDWDAWFVRRRDRAAETDHRQRDDRGPRYCRALCQDAARDAETVAAIPCRRPGRALSVEGVCRQPLRLYESAERGFGTPPALETRIDARRRQPWRTGGRNLFGPVFPGKCQGEDGGAGRQSETGDGRPYSRQRLDGA